MGLARCFDNTTNTLNIWLRKVLVRISELQNIRKKNKLIKKIILSKRQEQEIKDYYKKYYGKSISCKWHRLYQSYTGEYHVDYFPEIIFSTELEPRLNPYREAEFLEDKNLLPLLFHDVNNLHIPFTYISCIRGIYRDSNNNIINRNEAEEIIKNLNTYVIKKTRGTSSGKDVHICKNNEEKVFLNNIGKDYIVQELINQNEALSLLYPKSINTFRVITYICDGKIFNCPVALRMGRNGADRDNIHYGGIVVGVTSEGLLRKNAFSEYGDSFLSHPDSEIKFDNYSGLQKYYNKIIETAIQLHSRIPFLGILSWDLSLDNLGNVVLIEMNACGQSAWFCQMVNGLPLFGDNTPKMLKIFKQ